MKSTETTILSARDEFAAHRTVVQADYRTAAAQANYNARMYALQARFDREAATIMASFVAEIARSKT
jgi:hypothetical protein